MFGDTPLENRRETSSETWEKEIFFLAAQAEL